MNVIRKVAALDRTKSVFSESQDGRIEYISKCVVRSAIIQEFNAFRLIECPESTYFSETLATSLVGLSFSGVAFIRCSMT